MHDVVHTCGPDHGCSSSHESKGDLLESTEVQAHATEERIELISKSKSIYSNEGLHVTERTTKSQRGMKMRRAKGSKFDNTSLGIPCVAIVAACEVKLLLSWL